MLSLTAVVWSERRRRYVLRSFDRDDPACAGLLTHLGRTLVTSVTLRAGPLRHLRCVSRTDVPAAELFAAPGSPGRTFAGFLEESGRVEAIWYPFTDAPWLKVWTVSPRRPASSRLVRAPYNYPFSDTLSDAEQRDIRRRILSDPSEAVALGQESYADTVASLGAERLGRHLGSVEGRPALRPAGDAPGHRERLRHPHAPPGRPARHQRVRRPLPAVVAELSRRRACTR